jgi:biopolymer transport protein ExbB/TolQ
MLEIWNQMSWIARGVVIILGLLSIYSITVMIERMIAFSKAKKQSLLFARQVTTFLKQDNIAGAIAESKKYKDSHLARVVAAGLYEFQYEVNAGTVNMAGHDVVEAGKRAIEREALMVTADFKRGIGGLATIATTAPFIGLFGTVIGIIHSFEGISSGKLQGLAAVSGGIAEALWTTALGLFVAIPAVWMFNFFMNKIERFRSRCPTPPRSSSTTSSRNRARRALPSPEQGGNRWTSVVATRETSEARSTSRPWSTSVSCSSSSSWS